MKNLLGQNFFLVLTAAVCFCTTVRAQDLDMIGVTVLRAAVATNVDGSGMRVAQAEASLTSDLLTWEVNPAKVGKPMSLFTYFSAAGSASVYPNSLGTNSWHAEEVGNDFYGIPYGVATNVAHVDIFEADHFISYYISNLLPMPADPVVNQSFTFGALDVSKQQAVDSAYDDYSETFGTFFVSAACNSGISVKVCAPGTSYNCISVGAYANSTYYNSIGPTIDNGRCKPDITAPSNLTSFSTPQVSGAATVLMQAALRGDGGSDTNSAFDLRTIKALLLNGAVKPANWTNSSSSPLDARYGAGVVNVFNSYEQLTGGKHHFIVSTFNPANYPQLPPENSNSIAVLSGWDFNTNSTTATNDSENHYFFNVTSAANSGSFMATATLVWNRQFSQTNINNLDLFLFNTVNSNLIACSTSLVDNVEHIFLPQLAAGRYDLQVWKAGGANVVSDSETYALAWEFVSSRLSIAKSGTNAALMWPAYPAGFLVETTTNLAPPVNWVALTNFTSIVTNNQNRLILGATNNQQFFRLRRPNL